MSGGDVGEGEVTWGRWKYPFQQKHGVVPAFLAVASENSVKGGVP